MNTAFAAQAKVLTEINHDSILHVRDYFSEIGRQYLVMELVEGDDLQALLNRQKSCFPVSDVTGWADQLLDALNYLHNYRTPIIHRNIRPENIKLDSNGKIKLMAFGVNGDGEVQVQSGDTEGSGIAYSPLEQIWNGLDAASQKVIISKYDDRSERILKEDLDARSDIYSLGATLYHLVTARLPVDSLERSIEILEGRPDPLRSPNKIDPNIAPEISDVIIKAMEIKREYRFDSAAIMRQVLRTALVRVKEREAEDAREHEEAANDIKLAGQKKQSPVSEEPGETARIKQQLQEAEAQRLLAEQRAAEAEKRLRESEAARQIMLEPVAAAVDFDDDLLGVLSPSLHVSEAPKVKAAVTIPSIDAIKEAETEPSAEEVLADEPESGKTAGEVELSENEPVEEELVESWADEPIALSENKDIDQEHVDEVVEQLLVSNAVSDEVQAEAVNESPVKQTAKPVPESLAAVTPPKKIEPVPMSAFDEAYTETVERNGLPIPAMAIGAAVLIVIAIGIWMFMSSGTSEPPKTSSTQTPSTAEPAPTDSTVKPAFRPADVPVSVQSDPASTTVYPSTVKAVTTATSKPKKPAPTPAKAPTQKKAVTADDLINDN